MHLQQHHLQQHKPVAASPASSATITKPTSGPTIKKPVIGAAKSVDAKPDAAKKADNKKVVKGGGGNDKKPAIPEEPDLSVIIFQ